MKRVVLKKFGPAEEAFEISEAPDPIPGNHQVLIDVEAFGLNFADVLARKGMYPETPPLPFTPGYEVVGRIVGAGAEVNPEMMGRRVVALTRFGGYASKAVTDYRALSAIPDDYPAEKALALGTPGATAWICFNNRANLRAGDRVLIHAGAGGVGNTLCQLALDRGCTVFATAGSESKLDFLRELGVHHPINYRKTDYFEAVKKISGATPLDATFNSLGGKSFKKDLRLLGAGGVLVLYGAAARMGKRNGKWSAIRFLFQTGFFTPLMLIMGSKTVAGVNVLKLGDRKPQEVADALNEAVKMAEEGRIQPRVGGRYFVDRLAEAHTKLEERATTGKVSVFW